MACVSRHLHAPNPLLPKEPSSTCLPVHRCHHGPISSVTLVAHYPVEHPHPSLAPDSWHSRHNESMCLLQIYTKCVVRMRPTAAGCARGAGPAPQHHLQGCHRPGHGDGQGVGGGHPSGGGGGGNRTAAEYQTWSCLLMGWLGRAGGDARGHSWRCAWVSNGVGPAHLRSGR